MEFENGGFVWVLFFFLGREGKEEGLRERGGKQRTCDKIVGWV